MIIFFIVVCIVVIICFVIYKQEIIKLASENKNVNQLYNSADGKFVIEGKKNKFIITKDDNISFLVENGQIVACKDKRVSKEFKYYGGK